MKVKNRLSIIYFSLFAENAKELENHLDLIESDLSSIIIDYFAAYTDGKHVRIILVAPPDFLRQRIARTGDAPVVPRSHDHKAGRSAGRVPDVKEER
ncbi:hypothetical protein ACWGTO_26955 [Mesorhizobium sp. PL10]